MADVSNWQQASLTRAYIEQLESLDGFNEGLAEWIDWAKAYVDKIDPFNKNGKPAIYRR